MKKYIYILLCLFLFSSCEKELNFDYNSVFPKYVIEGRVTNEMTEVIITQTRDVENGIEGSGLEAESVVITTNDGEIEKLVYQVSDGYYRSLNGFKGEIGKIYSLSVKIDDEEFISQSQMNGSVTIDSLYFYGMKVVGDRFIFCRFSFKDRRGEENYYHYRLLRNGEFYKWDIGRDKGSDGEIIEENALCMTENTAEENKEEDRDRILYEDDVVELEIQTIDRRTYDYLNSLRLSESTSANPIANFTNGCLGYFSAYSSVKKQIIFKYADIKED